MIEVDLNGGLTLKSIGMKAPGFHNPFPKGKLPKSGSHWKRKANGTPPPKGERFPAVYAKKGGKKTLRVQVEITSAEGASGEGKLTGDYAGLKIRGKQTIPLSVGTKKWIDCEFEDLPDSIQHLPGGVFRWQLEANGTEYGIGSSQIELFFLLEKPEKPWKDVLWYEALKLAFERLGVGFQSKGQSIIKKVTAGLHSSGLRYDTKDGAPIAGWMPGDAGAFELSTILRLILGLGSRDRVNCYDMAGSVVALASVLGVHGLMTVFMARPMFTTFGYIKPTRLVGVSGLCNCPFFESYDRADFPGVPDAVWALISSPLKIGRMSVWQTSFGNHAASEQSQRIYDACAGPYTGAGTLARYVDVVIDERRTRRNEPGFKASGVASTAERHEVESVA